MAWLLLAHVAAFGIWALYLQWNVARDVAAFAADGAKDSLHEAFHRKRLLERAGAALGLAVTANVNAHDVPSYLVGVGGLLVLFAAYFTWYFNPALSKARGLHPYYVSADPHAAYFPDRWAWGHALRLYPAPEATEQDRRDFAELLLETTAKVFLTAGTVVYLLSLAAMRFLL
jgi:hypothetical protein